MSGIYKHLKIDKFVGGEKQRIFKTTTNITQVLSSSIVNKKGHSKNIYYGNYATNNDCYNANNQLSTNLIDFHLINYDYLYNRPDKINITTIYKDVYNPTFATSANIVKKFTTLEDNQRISYFPQYMYTPIDICKNGNSYYMLLPISTNRYINIAQPDSIIKQLLNLKDKPYGINYLNDITPYKKHYTLMISSFFNKPAYTSEDNSIPVYDLYLTNLQTIKFLSSEQAFQWILKWKLENIIYEKDGKYISLLNEILYDSTHEKFFTDDDVDNLDYYDSICIYPLISYLLQKYYLYGKDTVKAIMSDLLSYMDESSMVRFFNPKGKITNIQNELLSTVLKNDSNLTIDLNKQNIYNIKDLLTLKQLCVFGLKCLPLNTFIIGNTLYPLYHDSIKSKLDYFPSCYVNLIHMKNTRDPEYQIEFSLNDNLLISSNIKDWDIQKDGYISSKILNDSLYLFDGRFTIEYNNGTIPSADKYTLTKNTTQKVIDKAILLDNYNASINPGYVTNHPQRLSVKLIDYINQYNDKHIVHNRIYDAGTLNGFRNYLNTGNGFNNNIWTSYKYNCLSTNNTDLVFTLPFEEYNLYREEQWVTNRYELLLSTYTMKTYGLVCPWTINSQMFMGCKLVLSEKCNGFCTFPCKNKMRSRNNKIFGLTWNSKQYKELKNSTFNEILLLNCGLPITNQLYFIIPSSNYDRLLYTASNLSISDDLLIFFVSGINNDISFKNIIQNITLEKLLKSIYNGFGKNSLSLNDEIVFPLILYRNQNTTNYTIALSSNFNGPHIIPINTQLVGYNLNTNIAKCKILPAGYFALFRIKNWWSLTVKCTGTIETKNIDNKINEQVLSTLLNYLYILSLDGYYKFKQKGLHKSNIYSINLANTGLNPSDDKEIKYYTKQLLIKLFQQKYFIKYYLNEDNFLIATDLNLFIFTKYYSHHNDNDFCKTPLFKYLDRKYKESNFKDLNGFILWLKTLSFLDLIYILNLEVYRDEESDETLYYYPEEVTKATLYNTIRLNIRQLLEEAIKKSVNKYMPADTTLWKIKYTGD